MSKKADTPDFKVPNLQRGLEIIEFFVDRQAGYTLTELAGELGYPKNSTSRILRALEHYGYLSRDPETREYALTRKFFSMGYQGSREKNLMENALDVMRAIRDTYGETVVVSVMDDDEGLVLEQVQGTHPFRFVCDPGIRQPPHATASTKAIIAFLAADEIRSLAGRIDYRTFTPNTITGKKAFLAELKRIRKRGYALDRGEFLEGVRCAAAPIFDLHGNPIASITITGPANRLSNGLLKEAGTSIMEGAMTISQRFGYGLVEATP